MNKEGFNLNYHANDTFAKVHMDPSRFIFIRGPVGSGKSSGCIWHCILNAMKQNPDYENVRRGRMHDQPSAERHCKSRLP